MQIQARQYQLDAIDSIFNYFNFGNTGNPIVAMPTGTGKSVVIALFIYKIFMQWSNQRIMMLTHVQELIEQNANKLLDVWPTAPLGIHSAGLKKRDLLLPIIFGGVKSVASTIEKDLEKNGEIIQVLNSHFGHIDLLLIDECHLLSDKEDSDYQYVITELKKINPYLKVIGFSATPFRLKMGLLTDGLIFTDFCYDITRFEDFNKLIKDGYLCELIPKRTESVINVNDVHLVAGEFNQKELEAKTNDDKLILAMTKESIELAYDRNAWLIFGTGIENCERIASCFQSFGFQVAAVHSKLSDKENKQRIEAFKRGELRGIANANKLTTGFDHPPIDFIGEMGPTMSPNRWVQKAGRGTRPSPETRKENCLLADFAGNTKRLGPINDPCIPSGIKKNKKEGTAPIKICPECNVYNHASLKFCICCGYEFKFDKKLTQSASRLELLKKTEEKIIEEKIIESFNVNKVIYNLHNKAGSPPSIKVTYFCELKMFSEWVCPEHIGGAGILAKKWWKARTWRAMPPTTNEALQLTQELRQPTRISVHTNKKFPEIINYEY